MILLIDNYDSFVYNLARYIGELGYERCVKRNDEITIDEIEILTPTHIIISPGPCAPDQAGISLAVIRRFAASIPILGVCLGHQAIGQAFGAAITRAKSPAHGKSSLITHDEKNLFAGMPQPLRVGRYHSLIIAADDFPEQQLKITALCPAGEIMAVQHVTYPMFGVQFHPESVLTEQGYALLKNFLKVKIRT
jgi:anthranilate synthase/aminodeoxychorismate synthase-like glutamine amidotransferase